MKKILLFGGSGLVGSRIRQILSDSFHIIAPAHSEVDVTKEDTIRDCISMIKPGCIIYAAGVSSPDRAEEEREYAMVVNARSPERIATIAAARRIPIIYLSSDAVFRGNKKSRSYKEDDPTDPVNFYGFTKQKGEEYVLAASAKNCVLRLITVYSHSYPRKLDVARLAIESFRRGKSFTGIVDQHGNPTYVDTVVFAIARIIKREICGVLHFGAQDFMSNYEFIKTIARVCGFRTAAVRPITLKEFNKNKKVKRGEFVWLDTQRARSLIGNDAILTIEENIKRFWSNFSSQV